MALYWGDMETIVNITEMSNMLMTIIATVVNVITLWPRMRLLIRGASRLVRGQLCMSRRRRRILAQVRLVWLRDSIGILCGLHGALSIFAMLTHLLKLAHPDVNSSFLGLIFTYFAMTFVRCKPELITGRSSFVFIFGLVFLQMAIDHTTPIVAELRNAPLYPHVLISTLASVILSIHWALVVGLLFAAGRIHLGKTLTPSLLLWQVTIHLFQSHLLLSAKQRELTAMSAENAFHAAFSLLKAQYDAVVELDEAKKIVGASRAFYGMIAASVPKALEELSTRMVSFSSSQSSSRIGEEALSFAEMVDSPDERRNFERVLDEQKTHCLQRMPRSGLFDLQHESHATAMHTTIMTTSGRRLRIRFLCTCCYDVLHSRCRFFLGLCALEELPILHNAQSAFIRRPRRKERYTTVHINAASPTLELLSDLTMGGRTLPAGSSFRCCLTEPLFNKVQRYLTNKLTDVKLGSLRKKSWKYGFIGATTKDGEAWTNSLYFDLISNPWSENTDVVQVLATIKEVAEGSQYSSAVSGFPPLPSVDEEDERQSSSSVAGSCGSSSSSSNGDARENRRAVLFEDAGRLPSETRFSL